MASFDQKDLAEALKNIREVKDLGQLNQLRLKYLGRKGVLTTSLRDLKSISAAERKDRGRRLNQAKIQLNHELEQAKTQIESLGLTQGTAEPIDLTAPANGPRIGHLHPIESLQQDLIQIFWQLGFQVAEGPEVETDWYCFEALNMPPGHPARDMQDTFYLENGLIPRTHTSAVQIRYMESHKPPIRVIVPGKVYRNEDEDASHIWAFQQIEGLVVDKGMSLADLKGTLLYMARGIFGEAAQIRLRPSYFPYTEPSLEMDARPNARTPWLELGGAGMVHPQVLRNVGIDPKVYTGFAWGFGFERLAAIKYRVKDIRHFWRPDLRFLEQF